MVTKVQLNFIRGSILLTFFLWSQVHTAINGSSKIVHKLEQNSFRHGDALEFTVLRYLHEIKNRSSLVHLITETPKDGTDKSRETIVKTCSNFRVSMMLLRADETLRNFTPRIEPQYPKVRYVLTIARKITSLQPERWKEIYQNAWKSEAFFGIFIEDETVDDKSAETMLKRFWNIDCSNVVLVDLTNSSSHATKIYSYDPFSNVKEGTNGKLYQVNSTELLFPDKLKNLRGHPILISLYRHYPCANLSQKTGFASASGMDIELIRYSSRRLNFTVSLVTHDVDLTSHVSRLPSGRKIGPIGDILKNKSVFLANAQFLEVVHLYNSSLDFVYPYWRSNSVVVVQRASPLPAFFYLIKKADGHVFYVGISALILFFIYLKFIKKKQNFLLTILGLVLFQNLPKIGKLNSDRIFCFAFIYCSFVICTMYQGYLVNDLTAPPIFPNIDTLHDLANKKSLILMVRPYEMRILHRAKSDENKQKLIKMAVVELNFSECVTRMIKSKNIACAIDEGYGRFALGQFRKDQFRSATENDRQTGKVAPPMHIVRESLTGFWQSYMVRKGFPYLEKIDEAMGRAFQFGLIRKWSRDDKRKRFHEPSESAEPRTLSLFHLDYTFGILVAGHVLATVVFIFEIMAGGGWWNISWTKIRRGLLVIIGR